MEMDCLANLQADLQLKEMELLKQKEEYLRNYEESKNFYVSSGG